LNRARETRLQGQGAAGINELAKEGRGITGRDRDRALQGLLAIFVKS